MANDPTRPNRSLDPRDIAMRLLSDRIGLSRSFHQRLLPGEEISEYEREILRDLKEAAEQLPRLLDDLHATALALVETDAMREKWVDRHDKGGSMPKYDQTDYKLDWPVYDREKPDEGGYYTEVLDPRELTTEQTTHLLAALLDHLGLQLVEGDVYDGPKLALRERAKR